MYRSAMKHLPIICTMVFVVNLLFGWTLIYATDAIQPWTQNTAYWQYKGQPILLVGSSVTDHLFLGDGEALENGDPDVDLLDHLNEIEEIGGNYVRNVMSQREGWPRVAFHQIPVGSPNAGKFNLLKFNDQCVEPVELTLEGRLGSDCYWTRFDAFLEATKARDIIVQIELWDRFDYQNNGSNQADRWGRSPWNPDNNINYPPPPLPDDPSLSGFEEIPAFHPGQDRHPFFHGVPEFHDVPAHPCYPSDPGTTVLCLVEGPENVENLEITSNTKEQYDFIRGYQEAFVDKMLSYSLHYDHVLYVMNNETSAHISWGQYWINYIKERAADPMLLNTIDPSPPAPQIVFATEMFGPLHSPLEGEEGADEVEILKENPEVYEFLEISQVNSRSESVGGPMDVRGHMQHHWDKTKHIINEVKEPEGVTPIRPVNHVKIYNTGYYGPTQETRGPEIGIHRMMTNLLLGSAGVRHVRQHHRNKMVDGELVESNMTWPFPESVKSIRLVETKVKFWDLVPDNDLLSNRSIGEAFVGAQEGEAYVVYFPEGGSVGLNLSTATGSFTLEWLNYDTATWDTDSQTTVNGGATTTIASPPMPPGPWIAVLTKTGTPETLTVTLAGTGSGTVTSIPSGINCPSATCSADFSQESNVTLTAVPASGSAPVIWSGAADCGDGVVTMSTAVSCTATFNLTTPTHALTVMWAGTGSGSVTSQPPGIDCSSPLCSADFEQGSDVTLTPMPASDSEFSGWSGDADCSDDPANNAVVTMSTAVSCTATFTLSSPQTFSLTVIVEGEGTGSVTSTNLSGIDCEPDCIEAYSSGTSVALTAAPAVGSQFAGWDDTATPLVVMEAENAHRNTPRGTHSWVEITAQNELSGDRAMSSTPDIGTNYILPEGSGYFEEIPEASPELEFDVNFSTIGTYHVWVLGNGPNGAGDSLHMGLNGMKTPSAEAIKQFNPLGSWVWSTGNGATITVGATGTQTVNVWFREDGMQVDKILLTTDANYVPTGFGPAESPQQGNAFIPSGNGNCAGGIVTMNADRTCVATFSLSGGGSAPVQYVRLVANSEVNEGPWTSVAELNVLDETGVPIDQSGWTVVFVDSEELIAGTGTPLPAVNAFDGDPTTMWHTEWRVAAPDPGPGPPHELVIDLGALYSLSGFRYLPRQDVTSNPNGAENGRIAEYEFYSSNDTLNWGLPLATGTFPNVADEQEVLFSGNPPNQAPNGVIDTPVGNQTITAGSSLNFSGTGMDTDNNIPLTHQWTFGVGSGIANSTLEDPGAVIFNTAGDFTITYMVTDGLGLVDATPATVQVTVNAINQAPNGVIDTPSTNQTITVGDSLSFTGTGTDPDPNLPLTHEWNFGAGSGEGNSTQEDPGAVTFNTEGVFTVTYTVTDGLGLADPTPATVQITVEAPATSFTAYNDLAWGTGQLNTNITTITTATGGSGLPSSGELLDFTTGNGTGVTLSVTGGNFNGISHATKAVDPAIGTDAYNLFDGIVSGEGSISYINDVANVLVLTFSGLDPGQTYDLVYYAHRDDYAWDRASLVTLSGQDAFTNISSVATDNPNETGGVLFTGPSDLSTRLPADNDNGYTARFVGVDPGSDGEIVLTISFDGTAGSEYKAKYGSAVRLQEE